MPDQTLEILIQMQADLAALKDSVRGVEELNQKTKESGRVHEEVGEHVKKHGSHHRELHRLIHAVAHESPIAGLALRTAFGPVAFLIMAAVTALELFKKHQEEVKKAAEELNKVHSATWEAARKGIEEAESEARRYAESIKKAGEQTDQLGKKYEYELKLLEAIQEQHKKILELTGADETVKRANDIGAEAEKLELKNRHLKEAQAATKELDKSSREAQAALDFAKSHPEAKAEGKVAGQSREQLMGKLLEAQRKFAGALDVGMAGSIAREISDKRKAGLEEEVNKAQEPVRHFDANTKAIREHTLIVERLTAAAKEAEAKLNENTKKIQSLTTETTTGKDVLGIHTATAFKETFGAGALGMLQTAEGLAGKKGRTPQEDALMRAVAEMITGHTQTAENAAKILTTAASHTEDTNGLLNRMLNWMESRGKDFGRINTRLSTLEQQIKTQRINGAGG